MRRITHISEVRSVEDGQVQLEHLFEYRLAGYAADGRAVGEFITSGARPKFYEKLRLVAGESSTPCSPRADLSTSVGGSSRADRGSRIGNRPIRGIGRPADVALNASSKLDAYVLPWW